MPGLFLISSLIILIYIQKFLASKNQSKRQQINKFLGNTNSYTITYCVSHNRPIDTFPFYFAMRAFIYVR